MDPAKVRNMVHNVPTLSNRLNLNTLQVSLNNLFIFHFLL